MHSPEGILNPVGCIDWASRAGSEKWKAPHVALSVSYIFTEKTVAYRYIFMQKRDFCIVAMG